MPTLFIYLLQTSGVMTIFYLGYITCFKKETFYSYNRILLLSAFIFSAVLPLLPLPAFHWSEKAPEAGTPVNVYFADNANPQTPVLVATPETHWWEPLTQNAVAILSVVYIAVAVILIVMHLLQLWNIRRLAKSGDAYVHNNIRYVKLNGLTAPFSFLRTIFFDPNAHEQTELQHILKHEEAHVLQYHSADMLLSSLYCCLCWINPFAWCCKRALQLNLEFLADEAVIKNTDAPDEYQYSLLKIGLGGNRMAVVNHFSKSFIKNRILMMNKTQSPPLRTWRYLLLLPVLTLTAGLLSATQPEVNDSSGNKYISVENGMLYGVITPATSDKDLEEIKSILKESNSTLMIPVLKRKADGNIDRIQFEIKNPNSGMSVSYVDHPMETFFFYSGSKERGIGPIPLGTFPQSLIDVAIKESNGRVKGVTTDSTYANRFPGGKSAYARELSKTIRYPRVCQEENIAGNVMIQYKILPDGTISNVEVLRAPHRALGAEVKRAIEALPAFRPDPSGKTEMVTTNVAYMLEKANGERIQEEALPPSKQDIVVIGYASK
ncbi:M56 family metallopeptidase [Chitinophaga arvensicola]|uniref:TonB family C-terminal domain-containing protein n=1 Tax=Chitinophaga arvensicola TaxID=29529 RepID=A0A1I0P7T3_9BACT|nr:M56 family metallopeptidase [Chitinophaga arvensicola]SEW10346.1 TonB family C-terminal domain-containing protein [Chitinophaga arvensicola]